ncbi:MAG: glycosyltransferase family 39 protein [Patescibacteria group bacterium]|nr:glycosyltransferase family 39 protein [Patescibacteria group bacterium]
MILSINQKKIRFTWQSAIHIFALLFFIFYISKDLNYNTAFVDEAIYATVGEEVLRGIFWESALSWMGGSYIYPVISASINRVFGLEGIRLFSMICVFWTGIMVGKIGQMLSNQKGGIIATVLFLYSSVALDMAQLATYDAPALLFLAASFYTLILAYKKADKINYVFLVLSALSFALSVFTKYVAILFLPIVFIVNFLNTKKIINRYLLIWSFLAAGILGAYTAITFESLKDYFTSTAFTEKAQRIDMALNMFNLLNVSAFGAIVAFALALRKKSKYKWLVICFLIAGSILPAYHLFSSNLRAMWKHMAFSLFFLSPLAASILIKGFNFLKSASVNKFFIKNAKQFFFSLGMVAIVTYIWVNFSSHWRFQRSWPSAEKSIEYLWANKKENDKVFAEASAVYKYHMFAGFYDPSSWASTWYFEYEGKTGLEAMKKAINDKYFSFIILNYYFTKDINQVLLPYIKENYQLALTDKFKLSGVHDNVTEVWTPIK